MKIGNFIKVYTNFILLGFPLAKLQRKTLVLQVLDFDMFSKDDPIGEVEVQLGELNFYQPNEFHLHLSPCTGDRVRLVASAPDQSTFVTVTFTS